MSSFELVLFSVDPALIAAAVRGGVATVMVDWEHERKADRQLGADTEINRHTASDLRRVRAATRARVICRVNAYSDDTAAEIEAAVAGGADEVLLPMVRTREEVASALRLVAGRVGLGILVETREALALAPALARLPLSRVYVGLNDLAIDRRSSTIFAPLVDGTLDALRPRFEAPFGFGGLTLPERGAPLPARLLIGELARLRCSFSFLRRSFHRDAAGGDVAAHVRTLLAALDAAFERPDELVVRDRRELVGAVGRLLEPDVARAG